MSATKKVNMFNVNPLVIEMEEVLKNGLNKILADYMYRYELLENTHKQIMRLPSIRQELNKHPYDLYSDDDTDEQNEQDQSRHMTYNAVETFDNKLRQLEKKYDTIIPVLDKILNKIISLDEEVKSLKSCETTFEVKSSACNPSEKENIKIHFEEPSEELVEEEIEESDEEDFNPALITCSTITLNKEPEKVEEKADETTVNLEEQEEEDDELSVGEELGEHEEPTTEESEAKPDNNLADDVEDETEEAEDADVEDNVEEESEAKSDDNSDGDVEEQSEVTVEADVDDDVDDDVEEEASIETETKYEEEEEEEEEEEVVQEKPPSEEEEDDGELFEIEIDDKTYCTTDDQNGFIWELTEDGEQGEKIGYLKDGDAFFYEDEN